MLIWVKAARAIDSLTGFLVAEERVVRNLCKAIEIYSNRQCREFERFLVSFFHGLRKEDW